MPEKTVLRDGIDAWAHCGKTNRIVAEQLEMLELAQHALAHGRYEVVQEYMERVATALQKLQWQRPPRDDSNYAAELQQQFSGDGKFQRAF